jgi:hypothetical protein
MPSLASLASPSGEKLVRRGRQMRIYASAVVLEQAGSSNCVVLRRVNGDSNSGGGNGGGDGGGGGLEQQLDASGRVGGSTVRELSLTTGRESGGGAPLTSGLEVKLFSHRPSAEEAEGTASSSSTSSTSSSKKAGSSSGGGQVVPIDAVYGIYDLLSGPFVAVVVESEARVVGCGSLDFRRATKIAVLPLFAAAARRLTKQQQLDEARSVSQSACV